METSQYFYTQIVEAIDNREPGKGEIVSESYLIQIENYVKNSRRYGISIGGQKKTIRWGVIQDLTSATVDYGKQSAMGLIDAARYVNENGGINGKKLELIVHDDKYLIAEGEKIYQRFRDEDNVFGIYAQSTGTNQSRNPRMVYLFPDNPYGRNPLEAAKSYAKKLDVEVGPDQIINWPTIDTSAQLTAMQEYDPDFAYISSTAKKAVSIFKDAHRLDIKTKFICNMRVFNEELIRLGMSTVDGALGIQPLAFYGEKVPGMEKIVKSHDKWHPYHYPTLIYVEGWANVLVLAAALKVADDAGELSPEGLKNAFENFRNFSTEGLTPPISYFENDHRATTETRLFKISNDTFTPISDYIDVGRTPGFL